MTIKDAGRQCAAFLLAVAATAILASIVQTQFNLAAIQALGAPVPAGVRALTTFEDIVRFGPVMAGIAAAAFLPAFLIAALVRRHLPDRPVVLHAVAGAMGLWVAFFAMGFVTPMPNLIAALRTLPGLLAVVATGLAGGAVFALARRNVGARRAVA